MEERCRFGYFDGWPYLSFIVPPISHLVLRSPVLPSHSLKKNCSKCMQSKWQLLNQKCQSAWILSVKRWWYMYCDYLSSVFSDTWPSLSSFIVTLMHTFFCRKMQIKRKNVILGTQFLEFHYGCYQLYILRPTIQSLITHTYFIK